MHEDIEAEFTFGRRLKDIPSQEDHFSGGGHDRTASALVQGLIELSDEDGAIGLEGEWGSGKSTVIRLAQEQINSDESRSFDYIFFEFDLWIHQTDDFKRAFLISFLGWLNTEALISSDNFKRLNDRIRSRKTVTTTEDRTEFTRTAKWLFFSILLAPLSLVLMRWQLGVKGGANPWLLVPFILFAIAPLLVTLWSILWHYCRASDDAGSEVIAIFKGQAKEATRKQFIRDENPTSTEFRQTFDEIMQCVQKKPSQRAIRFIIVLDNIDRLPEANIPDLWAELRTFFAYSDSNSSQNDDPITVIVPYDKRHILSCLVSSHGKQNSEDKSNQTTLGPHMEDIFHKTFTATFRVSTPVLSDAKQYFHSQLHEAFGNIITESDSIRVYQLFNHWMTKENRKQAPRLIKSFINELVTIWNSRGTADIPILAISLFSLRRGSFEDDLTKLRNASYVDAFTVRHLADLEWSKYVAALYFNVETSLAYQVLLRDEIRSKLFSEDKNDLSSIEENPGFTPQLLAVIDESLSSLGNRTDLPALRGLAGIKGLTVLKSHDKDHILRAFIDASSRLYDQDLIADIEPLIDDLCYPIEHFSGHDQNSVERHAVLVQKYLLSILKNHSRAEEQQAFARLWLKTYNQFLLSIKEFAKQSTTKKILSEKIDYNSYEYLFGMATVPSVDLTFPLSKLNINIDSKLDEAFKQKVEQAPAESEVFTKAFGQSISKSPYRLGKLAQIAANHLDTVKVDSASDELTIIGSILNLTKHHFNKDAWNILNDSNAVFSLYHSAIKSDRYDIAAGIRFYLTNELEIDLLKVRPDVNVVATMHSIYGSLDESLDLFDKRTNNTGSSIEDEIAAYAEMVVSNDALLDTGDLAKSIDIENSFYREVFRYVVSHKTSLGRIVVKDVGYNYESYADLLGDELTTDFLTKYSRFYEHYEKAFRPAESVSLPVTFLEKIKELDLPKLNEIPAILSKHLKSIKHEAWKESLLSEDHNILSALTLRRLSFRHGVSTSSFKPALLNVTQRIIDQTFTPKMNPTQWSDLALLLQKKSRNSFTDDILIYLGNKNTLTGEEVVKLVNIVGFDRGIVSLTRKPNIAILKVLIPLLSIQQSEAQKIIDNLKDDISLCYKQSDQNTKDELLENLEIGNSQHETVAKWFQITMPEHPSDDIEETTESSDTSN